jgi:hypothetical protein
MGPRADRLGLAWAPPALDDARRWRERLERAWGVTLRDLEARPGLDLAGFTRELEDGLQLIDFPEVSAEDRIAFIEHAVAWQVRRALRAGRFELALELQALGVWRAGELSEERHGWRPVLVYGTTRPERPPTPPRAGEVARAAPRRPTR